MKTKDDNYYEAGDYENAVKCYRVVVEQGDVKAQYNLGRCCYSGQRVPQDKSEAITWYKMSASEGIFYSERFFANS